MAWWNVELMSRWNGKLTTWLVDEMAKLTTWKVDKMANGLYQNDKLKKYQNDKVPKWQNDELMEWPADKLA